MYNGQDVNIQNEKHLVLDAPDRVNIPCLIYDTHLCQLDVEMIDN